MRYYFHVDDGTPKLDVEGIAFPSDKAAWEQATLLRSVILHDIVGNLKPGDGLHIEVRDQTERLCFTFEVNTAGTLRPSRFAS